MEISEPSVSLLGARDPNRSQPEIIAIKYQKAKKLLSETKVELERTKTHLKHEVKCVEDLRALLQSEKER